MHEHASVINACYDSANRDAHPVKVTLRNEVRDRLTILAVEVIAATEAARASIRVMAISDLEPGFHCLDVPVLTQVPTASCGEGPSVSSSQSAGHNAGNS